MADGDVTPARSCTIAGCERRAVARGLCNAHWQKWRKYGDPTHCVTLGPLPPVCEAPGCDQRPIRRWRKGLALCNAHALRMLHHGQLDLPARQPLPPPAACGVDGCDNPRRSRSADHCEKHYYQIRRIGRLGTLIDSNKYEHCQSCGEPTERGHKFCGAVCSSRWKRAKAMSADPTGQKAYFIAQYHRRRAKLADAFVENVNPLVVFERDRWRCHLCGGRIGKKIRHPNPRCGTLDHVVPIAAGGEHSYANIKAAHLGCNCSKGARPRGQLALSLGDACQPSRSRSSRRG